VKAVGADDDVCLDDAARSSDDPSHPFAAVPPEVVHANAVQELGAAGRGRVDEDPVEQRSSGRVQSIDAVPWLDGDGHILIDVTERCFVDGRRSGRDDGGKYAPTVELQDAAAHQRVRRQGIGPVHALIHDEHAGAGSRQEESRGGARAAAPDNDGVEFRGHSLYFGNLA
jgi:hypothetical protein